MTTNLPLGMQMLIPLSTAAPVVGSKTFLRFVALTIHDISDNKNKPDKENALTRIMRASV
jgi:hypothetical protein